MVILIYGYGYSDLLCSKLKGPPIALSKHLAVAKNEIIKP